MQWDDAASTPVPLPWQTGRVGGALRALGALLLAERERWALWFPAAMGAGVALYFSLDHEPSPWLGGVGLAAAAALVAIAWRRGHGIALPLGMLAFCLGFGAAELQAALAAAPVLARKLGPVMVEGRLLAIDPLPKGARLVIAPTQIDRLDAARLPARVRVRLRRDDPALAPGAFVAVRAMLYPPPAPAMPGGYDFERQAYFDQLGAVGFALGPAAARAPPAGAGPGIFATAIAALRTAVTERIRAVLPGPSGAVAAALITGDTHAIPPAEAAQFRNAGLAHILVIAGLHMGMVAGIVFFAVRALLALVPAVALNYPTKKYAAAAALLVSFCYMLLSGATVSSRRAFVMIGLMLLGVLFDRLSLSARAIAWAAVAILLMTPASATGPSFQMSFAAVGALIAFYEAMRPRLAAWHRQAGAVRRFGLYLLGITFTTVVTTLATMPFIIYHFNRFPLYSIAANVLAVPVAGFWIMPWAIFACLLMPFGLEALALEPMHLGIELVAAIAQHVSSWPGAVVAVASPPPLALALLAVGGLWLCIWQRRWRWLGLAPMVAALVLAVFARPPDILVSGDQRVIAVRAPDGAYWLSSTRAERATGTAWAQRAAAPLGPAWPREGEGAGGALRCDAEGCIYRARGRIVALERDATALAEDCTRVDLVVSPAAARRGCRGPAVIDRIDTWRDGGQAIWLDPGAIRIRSVRAWQGDRPWVPRRGSTHDTARQGTSGRALSSAASARPASPEP